MSILSLSFLIFLLAVIAAVYVLPPKTTPYVLLAANCCFYLQFGRKHALLLLAAALVTFFGGLLIHRLQGGAKKAVLAAVLVLNLGFLFGVKFIPYILGNIQRFVEFDPSPFAAALVVPVGVSFYTLQLCGYCIDVYRGKYEPCRNVFKYTAFATFFPLMLQGPISRYDQLAPQLFAERDRTRFYANLTAGAQLMLWGFFKKLVIADRAGLLVHAVFDNYTEYAGVPVVVGALCYTLQIYADFSGCVDICRGAAKTVGIDLIDNFRQPYFSVSIQDFWRRWHIALSSWFKDYLYIPLGGNRKGTARKYANLMTVFLVSGLWHGVGIHYIVWGLLQGIFQLIGAWTLPLKKKLCALAHIDRESPVFLWVQRGITLLLVTFSWVIFRANGTVAAAKMLLSVFAPSMNGGYGIDNLDFMILFAGVIVLLITSYYREKGISIRQKVAEQVIPVRWGVYLTLLVIVLIFGIYGPGYSASSFIYMNF